MLSRAESWAAPRAGSFLPQRNLRTSDEDTGQKHEHASEHDLNRGRHPWRVHVAVADCTNDGQLNHHHHKRDSHRDTKIRNEERKRVPNSAQCRHQSAHRTSNPRPSPSCK